MRTTLIIVLFAVSALSSFAQSKLSVGEIAPTFAASTLDGDYVDLARLRGSVVVVTFWSTKCAICHSEIPKMNAVATQYAGKAVFLALTMENEERVNAYLRNNAFKFRVVTDGFPVLMQYADHDKEGNIDMGFPSYFVIDKAGRIVYRGSGWDKTAAVGDKIDRVLASDRATPAN